METGGKQEPGEGQAAEIQVPERATEMKEQALAQQSLQPRGCEGKGVLEGKGYRTGSQRRGGLGRKGPLTLR